MANLIDEKGCLTVSQDEHGSRLDRMLLRQLGVEQRSLMMRLIRKGNVRINGKRCKPNQPVYSGDRVFIPNSLRPGEGVKSDKPQVKPYRKLPDMTVLFEDEHLLAVDKPAGVVVHGGSGHDAGLIEILKQERGLPELRLAHRLDRDTSGVLLMAKTLEALRALTTDFRERDMDKTYLAWVAGHPDPHAARMRSHLSKGVTIAGERMVVDDEDGKLSVTDYQVILECVSEAGGAYALLALKPHSGRTHQLRVQLQQEGHAILGDVKYAERDALKSFKALGGKGLMLHAWRLRLLHPVTGTALSLYAPLPSRMCKFAGKVV